MQRELESARLTVVPWDTPFEILKGTYTRHRFAPHLHETFGLGAIEAGARSGRRWWRIVDVIASYGDARRRAMGVHRGCNRA